MPGVPKINILRDGLDKTTDEIMLSLDKLKYSKCKLYLCNKGFVRVIRSHDEDRRGVQPHWHNLGMYAYDTSRDFIREDLLFWLQENGHVKTETELGP